MNTAGIGYSNEILPAGSGFKLRQVAKNSGSFLCSLKLHSRYVGQLIKSGFCLLHSCWNSTECKYVHTRDIVAPVTKRDSHDSISVIIRAPEVARTPRVGRRTKPTPMAEATDLDYRGCHEPDTSKHIIRMYSMMSRSWSTDQWAVQTLGITSAYQIKLFGSAVVYQAQ